MYSGCFYIMEVIKIVDIFTWISLITGVVSIVLAIISIITSLKSEKNSQLNFEKTQDMMRNINEKTTDSLHQIDNKSSIISNSVDKSIIQLTNLFSNIIDKVIDNQKVNQIPDVTDNHNLEEVMETQDISNDDISNQIALQLLPELMKHPENLERLVEISDKINNRKIKE